jgi:hypothetical protein
MVELFTFFTIATISSTASFSNWDKIHIFADMASNKPFRMRKPDENEKGEYDKFYGSSADNMIGPMTQIHNIAEDGVAFKSLLFDPDSQPPGQFNKHGQAAEMIKLYIRRVFVTDDLTDMMPSDHNFVKNFMESNDPPLNANRSKRDQGRQLEALTEEKDSDDRQDEGVHDDHHQKFTLPNHEITSPMNATYKSIAMGEQNYGVKNCLIMFDEAHKGDVSKLYSETDNDTVSCKSATETTVMMHNTATLKSAYSLKATVDTDDEDEVPPEEHDDHDQAKLFDNMEEDVKKTATLDALFPTMQVPSTDEKQWTHHMHETYHYQEDRSRAKNMMLMALHHPEDRQDQTTSPALPMMREQVDDKNQTEVKMVPFATEGEEGITKCPSMLPAHFAAVTTYSFLRQRG